MKINIVITIWVLFSVLGNYTGFCQIQKDTTKSTMDIKVIEERVKQNEEKTNIQLDVLDEKIKSLEQDLDKDISKTQNILEKEMSIYIWAFGILIALIGFLVNFYGRKSIVDWIKRNIESKAKEEIKEIITQEYVENIIKETGEIAINGLINELDRKMKEKFKDVEILINEYENALSDLKSKDIDSSKPIEEETADKLEDFKESLSKVKDESKYTFDDWYYKGIAEYNKQIYKEAINSFAKALEIKSDSLYALIYKGNSYYKLDQYDKAIEEYNKSIAIDTNYARAYYNRGNSYHRLKQYDKAIADFNKAIELDPNSAQAYYNKGNSYHRLKQYNKAIADFNKAIELDPNDALAYVSRGISYGDLKQYDKATADFNKAIELDPSDVSAYENLAEAQIISGDYKSAIVTIDKIKEKISVSEFEDQIIIYYLEFIAKKIMKSDTIKIENEINSLLEQEFTLTWSFTEIEDWLENAKLDEETKKYIHEMTELLKKKVKPQ